MMHLSKIPKYDTNNLKKRILSSYLAPSQPDFAVNRDYSSVHGTTHLEIIRKYEAKVGEDVVLNCVVEGLSIWKWISFVHENKVLKI